MADEIKTGDLVCRKKRANDYLWKEHGYGYSPMRVTGTEGGHLQFNYKAYTWSRSCFERVNALQPGDIVMRKAEFRDYGGWKWGSQLHEVDSIYGNEVRLKGNSFDWSIENFDLVLRRNNLAAAQSALDEATKPLHHTIELRDARIRVLEGEVATLKDEAGLMRSHMRREGKRCQELEDEVMQLKVGLKETEERLRDRTAWSGVSQNKELDEKRKRISELENSERVLKARIVMLEHAFDEAKRALRMLKEMSAKAAGSFN